MNPSTGNSLLKILEEPPANVHFILTTERLSEVLPTITSRCSVVHFRRLRQDEIKAYLASAEELETDAVVSYAAAAEGSLKTARALAFEQKADILKRSRSLFDLLARGPENIVFDAAAQNLWSRNTVGAEELLKGFIQCTREALDHKYDVSSPTTSSPSSCALSGNVHLEALDRLSKQLESGLEMLGRNVAVATVLTMIFFQINETFADA
jgi:DNA polymerase-3 subunit delta'